MKILFLAAVDFELDCARTACSRSGSVFVCGGMGPDATREALRSAFSAERFDLAVDVGVAGSYNLELFPAGSVVQVVREFEGGRPERLLVNPLPPRWFDSLPQVTGNTVPALEARYRGVSADIETMEGAAFFDECLFHGVPFAEIRAVSNLVGEEDRTRWDIPRALYNLESVLRTLCP